MNNFPQNGHLLDAILTVRAEVGDGLNDDEVTRLLRATTLRSEAGFGFLSYADGMVTLTVPEQDSKAWYPQHGWMTPEKESVARALAEKYEFVLHEPPDTPGGFPDAPDAPPAGRHHVQLTDGWQTVVVAHPYYLKVRLLGRPRHYCYKWEALRPLMLGPDLLRDLSALYKGSPQGKAERQTPTQSRA